MPIIVKTIKIEQNLLKNVHNCLLQRHSVSVLYYTRLSLPSVVFCLILLMKAGYEGF